MPDAPGPGVSPVPTGAGAPAAGGGACRGGGVRMAVLAFLIVLGVRVAGAAHTHCIARDGPEYVKVARAYARGDWGTALAHPYHPLYPALIGFVHEAESFFRTHFRARPNDLPEDWERSARWVSLAASSLTVIPLWILAAGAGGRRAGLLAALLFAALPNGVEFGTAVLTTSLFTFLTLVSLAFGLTALRTGRSRHWVWGGLVAGLSYWVRLDGFVTAGALAAAAFLPARRRGRNRRPAQPGACAPRRRCWPVWPSWCRT